MVITACCPTWTRSTLVSCTFISTAMVEMSGMVMLTGARASTWTKAPSGPSEVTTAACWLVATLSVATRETAALAKQLIEETCTKQGIGPGELILHADRGSPMKAKTTALLLADLGVGKSHSRPHVSNDNPFSESQFKTLKYNPQFPDRFGSPMDARAFCGPFFQWYNTEFRHSGIAMMTPEMVHYGLVEDVQTKRQGVLAMAYAAHPERFVRGKPTSPELPNAVWINPPAASQGQIIKAVDFAGEQEAVA